MSLGIVQIDAFTSKAFGGNPAAVCLLPEAREADWMQLVAREMNLSETAFLVRQQDGFGLRWFTPAVEVELCGHATLASAHFLWDAGHLAPDEQARFHTLSGLLTAERDGDWIVMDFPARELVESPVPAGLLEALGISARFVGRNKYDYLVEVESEEMVRSVQPDFSRLQLVETRGVMVTSRASTSGYDFVSRFFAPRVGVSEDPVTGSAHCCLAPYWAQQLGRTELVGYQASARGGIVRVATVGDRVKIAGQAVTVLRGELVE